MSVTAILDSSLNVPVVRTEYGRIKGTSRDGISTFKGIPYAASIAGARKLRPPQAANPWSGIRPADRRGESAPQTGGSSLFTRLASDSSKIGYDCLNLNIWTRSPTRDSNLPVLVWIHGGGFLFGSGSDPIYDGTRFARSGIVVVTINYRLGALGYGYFGSLYPELATGGSLGLEDQIFALSWVQRNIAGFGGDPTRVTVAGQSAGAMSVTALIASPKAAGLFHQAILHSGAGANTTDPESATLIARELIRFAGIHRGDARALLEIPLGRLLAAQAAVNHEIDRTRDPARFGRAASEAIAFQPVHGTALLPEKPLETISRRAPGRPRAVLFGTTKDECQLFVHDYPVAYTRRIVASMIRQRVKREKLGSESASSFYLRSCNGPASALAAAETDRVYLVPELQLSETLSKSGTRLWRFRFDAPSSHTDFYRGAHHFLDVPYAFGNLDSRRSRLVTGEFPDTSVSGRMHDAWCSFIISGDPTCPSVPPWPEYHSEKRSTMLFSSSAIGAVELDERRLSYWDASGELSEASRTMSLGYHPEGCSKPYC